MNIRTTALLAAGLLAGSSLPGAVFARGWTDKVDPWVLTHTEGGATAEFLVVLADQVDLAAAAAVPTKREKGRWVFERLTELADATQGPVLAELARREIEHRAYWVVNMIWVRGDRGVVEATARRSDVARVAANPEVPLRLPEPPEEPTTPSGDIEPNLLQVGVLTFWNAGFTGQGVVVAGQDTGYGWEHPALINQYRGWNGSAANHNYNGHDSLHSGNPECGPDSPTPCDGHGHGTHTMGTMVGDDGGSNRIGMAPGARWIGCRNMDDNGNGTNATYTECFEWFIAPTDLDGNNADPDLAPHVINNSWGCPPSEGCADVDILKSVVEAARAAGIVVVVSAGNLGPSCATVDWPASIYEASFTVGAVNSNDSIASFSSRGPVTVDGSGRRKPDVSAPGVSIRSSLPGMGYGSLSGTSMAGPHVAGLVALNISADNGLAGDVDALETHIEATTLPGVVTGQVCGGTADSETPNNTYGWGVIRAALPFLFADGFESGDSSAWSQTVPN